MTADKPLHAYLVTCGGVDTEFAHLPHFLDHYLGLFGTVKIMALKGSLSSRGGHRPQAGDGPINYLFGRHLATFPRIGDARFRSRVPLRVH